MSGRGQPDRCHQPVTVNETTEFDAWIRGIVDRYRPADRYNDMKQIVAAGTALLVAPVMLVLGVAVIAGGGESDVQAATSAAVACTYGDPDPDRIAVAMEQLGDPVDADHYDTHAAAAGIDPAVVPHSVSTAADRHQVLATALQTTLATVDPRTVTTPVLEWWGAPLPTDDTDLRWEAVPVPGYGVLGDYVTEYLNVYAVDPAVLATLDSVECAPDTGGRCLPPDDLGPILETIRRVESSGDYTADGGAYDISDALWANTGGYASASGAPQATQDQFATGRVSLFLEINGNDVATIPASWILGHYPDDADPLWNQFHPDTFPITLRTHQSRWIAEFLDVAGADADTCPTPVGYTSLEGPDCDGLQGSGATYNGKVNGTLNVYDLEPSLWGPLQPAAAQGWQALVDAGIADGFPRSTFNAGSGGPGSRNGTYSNHTIGLALDINALAWTPTRRVPGERLPVAYVFDEALYQWLRSNAWRFGWCNPRWARPYYLNGTSEGGKDAAGNGNYLEPWHFEFAAGSDHYKPPRDGDLNGPLGIPD